MKQRRRIYYSAAQRAEIWDRWRRGEAMRDRGGLFDRGHSSVFSVLAPTGGIRPLPRKRSRLALSLPEREEISRGLVAGRSLRAIGSALGRAPSTISREIARNGGSTPYRAAKADKRAWQSALRPKSCKLARYAWLRQAVAAKLALEWSPQQIAGWLKWTNPGNEARQVSHETIYRSLYVQARGVLKNS
jgi:IS30 family transposase